MGLAFPNNFPTIEEMFNVLHKTVEKSWKADIDVDDILLWLSNFCGKVYETDDERRLALWLLCNFTYYSSTDINHLCGVLYQRFIHDFVERFHIDILSIKSELNNVFFSSIGSASESGGLLLYHFRQEADLSLDRFFYPTDLETDENSVLVFIDDATLSGGTGLRNYFNKLGGKKYKHIYYLTIIASEEAIRKLEEKGITTIYCILMDSRNKCFSYDSMIFNKFPELIEPSKKMCEEYGKTIIEPGSKAKPLGYDNGEFCFGFYYNTPNNTLPIFWSNYEWNPIFLRKEKKQNAKQLKFVAQKYI